MTMSTLRGRLLIGGEWHGGARQPIEVFDARSVDVDGALIRRLAGGGDVAAGGPDDRGNGLSDARHEDAVAIAEELAEALGAAVSCSRPVVDAKWLEKSRQVGSSGKTVKPKVYLACGISGAFQHLAGIKGNPFLIAINKNPKAPIFQVADVGIVDDILEFLPELTNKVREMRGVAAK